MTSKMTEYTDSDQRPWYSYFWLWFIIALPASVVVAGTVTVFIAFNNADSLVADDYYKDGLGINRTLQLDQVASEYQLVAMVAVDELVGELSVSLSGTLPEWPEHLELYWYHPTIESRDQTVTLRKIRGGQYIAPLPHISTGRWHVQLSSAERVSWRLRTELDATSNKHFMMAFVPPVAPLQSTATR